MQTPPVSNVVPRFTRNMLVRRMSEDFCALLAAFHAEDLDAARVAVLAIGEAVEDYEASTREFT